MKVDKKIKDKKNIVVVLGMHRSGTSVITRGLEVLGVSLGNHLMQPVSGDNDKGYFEDVDVNAINIELLQLFGQDWHVLATVTADELTGKKTAGLRLRAIELIRSRLQDIDCFGMKDPRLCRLLPFWESVFDYLKLNVSYVIAIRDPRSVAASLEKRGGMPYEKSYYLWLGHVLPSIMITQTTPHVVVDYDLVINNPEEQLHRIARILKLEHEISADELTEYCTSFIDAGLRHTEPNFKDIFEDPSIPIPVKTAIKILKGVALSKNSLVSKADRNSFEFLSEQMQASEQAMSYLDHANAELMRLTPLISDKDRHISNLEEIIQEREARIKSISKGVTDRDDRLVEISQSVIDKDRHIINQERMILQRDEQIEGLNRSVIDKDRHIVNQEQVLVHRDTQIENINKALVDKDRHIVNLDKAIKEFEKQVTVFSNGNAERDEQILSLKQMLVDKDRHIINQERMILQRDEQIEGLNRSVIDKDRHIVNQEQVL
ncbi:MAG: hypothetical protein OEY89_14325, partial [Gammaproteobacteria bacterium]|nr:hypothetical protein [Gammaproteobacteria bacterium]